MSESRGLIPKHTLTVYARQARNYKSQRQRSRAATERFSDEVHEPFEQVDLKSQWFND